MRITKFKKVLLAIGLGIGLSGAMTTSAVAIPQCDDLKDMCQEGNSWACMTYNRSCW